MEIDSVGKEKMGLIQDFMGKIRKNTGIGISFSGGTRFLLCDGIHPPLEVSYDEGFISAVVGSSPNNRIYSSVGCDFNRHVNFEMRKLIDSSELDAKASAMMEIEDIIGDLYDHFREDVYACSKLNQLQETLDIYESSSEVYILSSLRNKILEKGIEL